MTIPAPSTPSTEARTRADQGPDLRLAGPALGAWMSALWALSVPASHAMWLAGVAAGLALACWYGHRLRAVPGPRTGTLVLIGVLIGVVSGAVSTAARTVNRDAEPLAGLTAARATVRVDLTVTDDPRRVRAGGRPLWLIDARLTRVHVAEPKQRTLRLSVRVLVWSEHPAWRSLLPGQPVSATARLAKPRGGDLRAAVLSADAPQVRGEPPWVQTAAHTLRAGLQRAVEPLPDDAGGLLPGLAIGDVSRMDPAVEEDFRATGMSHLTAVSGSNVAIVTGLILLVSAWCRVGPRTAAALGLISLVGFVILVRPSPSVLRAAVMGALALVALASSRPRAAVPALAATVYLLIVVDPELAGDLGFALSVLATAGLLLLAPGWRDALRRRRVPAGVAEALVVPVAAQVACAPVIAAMTGTISLSAVPANLLAAPAVAPATVLGAAAAVVSVLSLSGAEFLAWLGSWPARWLVSVAHWGANLPASTAPWPDGTAGGLILAAVLTVGIIVLQWRRPRRMLALIAAAAVIGVAGARAVAPGWPPPGWVFVACDVGQGDALVLRTGDRHAIVVDAGAEPTPVDRCLRRLDIVTVPLLVFSHYHLDHAGGVAGVLRERRVLAIAGPDFPEPGPGHAAVSRAATDIGSSLLKLTAGWRYQAGSLRLEVLGPHHPQRGTRSDPNNNSLILRADIDGFVILLPGDAEAERQQDLMSNGVGVRADVLKLAHHGSAYQDEKFLAAVDPTITIVSVGEGNPYGHPDSRLLRQLAEDGSRVFRTDRHGDIAICRTAAGWQVVVRGPDRLRGASRR